MSSSSPSSSIPFRSKKPLQSSTTPKSKSRLSTSNSIATQTPDKPLADLPSRRVRNRRVALSVKEVRQIANSSNKNKSNNNSNSSGNKDGADRINKSARRQICDWPEESAGREVPNQPPVSKIPEKYEMLSEFFDSLDSSIKLLRLKGSAPTFTNISPKIECLTDRRFSHGHLAQLKYILPEVIEIKRILKFDERTSCMKPDLHVSLDVDAIAESDDPNLKSESRNLYLRKVFRARLADFFKSHPEGDDIPEELLPEPFNRSTAKVSTSSSTIETSTAAHSSESHQPVVACHLSQSFTRRFSIRKNDTESTYRSSSNICPRGSIFQIPEPCLDKVPSSEEVESSTKIPTKVSSAPAEVPKTPCKDIDSTKVDNLQSTPAKLDLTPAKLMCSTPAQHPQKRCYMTPDDGSTSLTEKLVRRPVRTRSLKFETHEVNDAEDAPAYNDDDDDDDGDDILKILPKSLLQSIREKERKAQEEQDPAISQAKRRRQMIACLPKLFNMMHFLFQSIKRSVITKEELIHKIIASHSDIADRSEVEEQLELMLELVPEWLSKKMASSGDLIFCINKMSSAENIRARLEEAK